MSDARRDELDRGLSRVRTEIAAAADAVGRRPEDVTLVVVTKTWPASDIRLLHDLGVRDIGENRHREASDKVDRLADLDLTWHFVGQIQSNKATPIARYADVVHSVSSAKVARRLNKGAHESARQLRCFVQVNLDPPGQANGRGGVAPQDLDEVADAVAMAGGLTLVGVMGVAPLDGDPVAAYRTLREQRDRLVARYPGAGAISGGMSGDFAVAVRAGATHVRVGSAILGRRPPLG